MKKTIELKEYARLLAVDSKMDALEGAGVDNWCGYSETDPWEYEGDIYQSLVDNGDYNK